MKESFAVIAALLAVLGNLPYLRDTIQGRVKPHPYTWFVWSLVSGTVLAGQIVKGAGPGALPTAVAEIFTIIIFFFSLRYGFRGITRIDSVFLALALGAIVLWTLVKDPTPSIVIAVGIDLIAFIPTFRKTWQHPATETPVLYGANVLRHALALLSMRTYNLATTLHSIAMITVNTAMVLLLIVRKRGYNGNTWKR